MNVCVFLPAHRPIMNLDFYFHCNVIMAIDQCSDEQQKIRRKRCYD